MWLIKGTTLGQVLKEQQLNKFNDYNDIFSDSFFVVRLYEKKFQDYLRWHVLSIETTASWAN